MFWASLASFVALYYSFLMKNDRDGFKEVIRTRNPNELLPSYDFIIVGAGSAGSALANRLSENPSWNVLLVEAGGQENEYSRTPAINTALWNSPLDWNYTTTKQKYVCQDNDGICIYPRGKALGGSGALNAMMFLRGYRSDYDNWGKDNPGWSFDGVKPYFHIAEGYTIKGLDNHNRNGPVTVSYATFRTEIENQIIKAGNEMGWDNTDCQDHESNCIFYTPSNIRKGRRCSSATAYLEPISDKRNNLHIVIHARVTKILMDGNTSTGIEFIRNNQKLTVASKKEVILSAGAIDSPKLLMLSGIGPKNHLTSLGIDVVADLPVGNNLQDHSYCRIIVNVSKDAITLEDFENGMDEYVKSQTGPLSISGYEITAFSSLKRQGHPLLQYVIGYFPNSQKQEMYFAANLIKPKSVGTVRLASADPMVNPLIDLNLYSEQDDFNLTLAGLSELVELIQQPSLKEYNATLQPSTLCPKTEPLQDYLTCLIRTVIENGHPVGTVKMSLPSKGGVVDTKLKVYGINNLRVVDASIAPTLISMNTNAMAIMIGEKGADIIKNDYS